MRQLRQTLSMSQETLADSADIDRTYVSSLESGRRNPSLTTIWRVATALGVAPHVLLALAHEHSVERKEPR